MAQDEAYRKAEQAIESVRQSEHWQLDLSRMWNEKSCQLTEIPESLRKLKWLQSLELYNNGLTVLPEWLGELTELRSLDLWGNCLNSLPQSVGKLTNLRLLDLHNNRFSELPLALCKLNELITLDMAGNLVETIPNEVGELKRLKKLNLSGNKLKVMPESLSELTQLNALDLSENRLTSLPESIGKLRQLEKLDISHNRLIDLPGSLADLDFSTELHLYDNPLNLELAAAFREGFGAVKRYLAAKAESQVVLNEAKLILIGEGEVGKSCLLSALRGDPWIAGSPTTHGIEIKQVKVTDAITGKEIILNGWDFGGQRVYRPTHQLFFSAPAVYLVVWKPREGPQQGFVKDWIKLVKHREPDAKMIIVATHGGPKERQPDIDRQEMWDLFGRETVVDFFLVESKPSETTQERIGIEELKGAIAHVASELPEMGRKVPKRWETTRLALKENGVAYLSFDQVLKLCHEHGMGADEARDFVRISHRLGHLIHYEHDPILRDIVVLKPDWLATAMSFVLDDKHTRDNHGLVSVARLSYLWDDPERESENRYPAKLHPIFLRLMERFDLSYRVAESQTNTSDSTSLIAQLVPDVRPDLISVWAAQPESGDMQQVQICQIVETQKNQSASAEGLFYQLIVRLHKYSMGRAIYGNSVHWQRGLVLEDDYGARAFLEYVGNDVRITVRSPYPERFLAALTYEVKWLVENFWSGLRCEVMVPCLNTNPCIGRYEVGKLIENKRRGRPEQPCPVCNEWQNIELLLHNAPAAKPSPIDELLTSSSVILRVLDGVRKQLGQYQGEVIGRFDKLDFSSRELVSKIDAAYAGLMQTMTDEAKDGPRLFSFEPLEPGFFDRPNWVSQKFRITLWCEHSRLPLPALNGEGDRHGVYDLMLSREWVSKAAPLLKVLTGTLSLIIPVASAGTKLAIDELAYKAIEKQLDFGQKCIDSLVKGAEKMGTAIASNNSPSPESTEATHATGSILRQLQAWLKKRDPSFGGLVRVQNKRQEFLWVHKNFEKEY